MGQTLHIIGFGSQGAAWAENLRDSGWDLEIYLPSPGSASWKDAERRDYKPRPMAEIPGAAPRMVAFLCPDDRIGALYREFLAPLPQPLTLVLAHGFAVYSGDLKPARADHTIALLAPKAIGPELRKAYVTGKPHELKAATTALTPELTALAAGLGFATENLLVTTPETECVGDLLSEQGLLCGGVFTLLDWTITAMRDAGIPESLIREECITELGLIANLLKARGLRGTATKISRAAAAGAGLMNESLTASGARAAFDARLKRVLTKEFAEDYRTGRWKTATAALEARLAAHDAALEGNKT